MKKSTLNMIMGTALATATGVFAYQMYRGRNKVTVAEGVDMRNSTKIDERESVDADVDPAEEGLTQLDATYREEWQANAFPQTHREMRELEEAEEEEGKR